jgi:hypothetical protein
MHPEPGDTSTATRNVTDLVQSSLSARSLEASLDPRRRRRRSKSAPELNCTADGSMAVISRSKSC